MINHGPFTSILFILFIGNSKNPLITEKICLFSYFLPFFHYFFFLVFSRVQATQASAVCPSAHRLVGWSAGPHFTFSYFAVFGFIAPAKMHLWPSALPLLTHTWLGLLCIRLCSSSFCLFFHCDGLSLKRNFITQQTTLLRFSDASSHL